MCAGPGVNLIANITTGLTVRAALDETVYETGITVTEAQMAQLKILRHDFHGEWNYAIKPRR